MPVHRGTRSRAAGARGRGAVRAVCVHPRSHRASMRQVLGFFVLTRAGYVRFDFSFCFCRWMRGFRALRLLEDTLIPLPR